MDPKDDKKIDAEEIVDIDSEIVPEDEGAPSQALTKLREKLKICVEEKQSYLDGWQRSKADFVNYKKKEEENRKEFVKFAEENLLSEIIPVLDSFDMAFQNKEAWEKAPKEWRMGIEYIYSQFLSALEKFNLKQFDPIGAKFDANLHAPIEMLKTTNSAEDGIVLEVIQKGYTLNGKAVREAKVKVGEYSPS